MAQPGHHATPTPPHMQAQGTGDHIMSVKALVGQLKESLANLMRLTAVNINVNMDSSSKASDGNVKFFEKSLEDFFSILNQIERHLKTISECVIQQKDSSKYLPFTVSPKADGIGPVELAPGETSISYQQYVNIIKNQVSFAKGIQDILLQGASQIGHQETQPGPQPTGSSFIPP